MRGATLEVVRAWHVATLSGSAFLGPASGYPPASFEDARAAATASLDAQVDEALGEGCEVDVVKNVQEGSAAQVVLAAAKGAELVVVGSRGRGGFAGLLLGSVSSQSSTMHCPVTVVG